MKNKYYCIDCGKSFEKYTLLFTEELRESIRKRDNYICQKCNNKSTKSKLHIHHINYNKKNCNKNNLISLCMKCHMKTNWNRKYWKKYFKNLTNTK
jgi:5-methylcytosine-specific restriction endonuclease McrA